MIWIILATILPVLSLLSPGMPLVHDGQDHVARIANFYAALKEGIIIPRWAANLNWGYGHPILMFLYPLPEYLAGAFHFLGFTLVNSTKLVFGASYIISAVTMYLWIRAVFGTRAAVIGAILYSFAPYRFVDLHVRGALGEHVAFIFPPLVLYFLHARSFIGVSLSLAALILSHNAVAIMFLPVFGLYGLYLLVFEAKKRWSFTVYCLLSIALGFSISAFFWIPAFFEGKFTLRYIVTAGEALSRFVPASWFIYSPWNFGGTDTFTKSLGFPQWVGIIGAFFLLIKTKEKKRNVFIGGLFFVLFASLFMMTSWSAPVWRASKILENFQFPWRFLSVTVFISAAIGGIALARIPKRIMIIFCAVTVAVTANMWRPKGYQIHDESFYSGVYPGTTDTGESSPIWSTRFMEHTPANPLEVVDGVATVTRGRRSSTVHEYTLDVKKPTLMLENTVYFPGWHIYLDGVPTGIQFQNPDYRGLMLFRVAEETKNVRVVFEDTKVRRTANIISIASIGVLVFLWIKKYLLH